MDITYITPNKNGDTRVADHMPTISEFDQANTWHRDDVCSVMSSLALEVIERGKKHDYTKVTEPYRSHFYNDFYNKLNGNLDDFKNGKWRQEHVNNERHHLNDRVPLDVNLIDILEMLCDVVCAGKARSGSVYFPDVNKDVLYSAYKNTFDMIKDSVLIKPEGPKI